MTSKTIAPADNPVVFARTVRGFDATVVATDRDGRLYALPLCSLCRVIGNDVTSAEHQPGCPHGRHNTDETNGAQ